jgi:PAS domain S-box-containing protein
MSDDQQYPSHSRVPSQFEKEEAWLWRIALLFLVLLAAALAAESWERLHDLPYHLGLMPVALFCVAIAFAAFSYGRRKRVTELKTLVQGLQERATPTEAQLDQLGQVIARSQRSFKELIDSIDDVAFAMSLDGTVRTVNRRLAEVMGNAYGDIVNHKLDELLEAPNRAEAEVALSRFLEKRRWSGLVTVKIKNNPRLRYFDCVLNAIVKSEEVVGVSVLARDVTEEREKERRFTELFETLQEGVYFSTPEGKLLDANTALVQMLGYGSKEELIALDATGLNSDANRPAVLGRSADDRGGVRTREISLRRKDGSTGVFLDASRAVWDASGTIIRYQGTLVDVTGRREMERTLRQQEEFQRYLLESFPDLILVMDLEERYSFVSARIRDLLGFKPSDLIGTRLNQKPGHSPEFVELCREVNSGKKKVGFCEFMAQHRDGSWRTMRASASPMYDAENRPSGVIASVRDITIERKLEQQIIQSERLAAMGQMIGGFAHELNNPLTSILGLSELLLEDQKEASAQKQLTMLQQQAKRAADIVANLTYFSRPPAPGKSPIQLSELVQRTLHLHAYSLRKNNITVDFIPDPTIPTVGGDPHQLMQVFLNLILNAEQAMREVHDRGLLRIRLAKADNLVMAIFEDNGPGIAPEILPNIFDPFYTTKRPGRGTGLGLSISKAILREHGGNVEAASGSGGGAVFTVSLPANAGLTQVPSGDPNP